MGTRVIQTGVKIKLTSIDRNTNEVRHTLVRRVHPSEFEEFENHFRIISNAKIPNRHEFEIIEDSIDITVQDIHVSVSVDFPDEVSKYTSFRELYNLYFNSPHATMEKSRELDVYGKITRSLKIKYCFVEKGLIPNFNPNEKEDIALFQMLRESEDGSNGSTMKVPYCKHKLDTGPEYDEAADAYIVRIDSIECVYSNMDYDGKDH